MTRTEEVSPIVVKNVEHTPAPGSWGIAYGGGESFEVYDSKQTAVANAKKEARNEGRVGVSVENRNGSFDGFVPNNRFWSGYRGERIMKRG